MLAMMSGAGVRTSADNGSWVLVLVLSLVGMWPADWEVSTRYRRLTEPHDIVWTYIYIYLIVMDVWLDLWILISWHVYAPSRSYPGLTRGTRWWKLTSWTSAGRQTTGSSTGPPWRGFPTCGGTTWRTRLLWSWIWNEHAVPWPASPGRKPSDAKPAPMMMWSWSTVLWLFG